MRFRVVATVTQMVKGFTGILVAANKKRMLRAMNSFLAAAAPSVPIDTGMARGSFINLFEYLKRNQVYDKRGVAYINQSVLPRTPQRVDDYGDPLKYYHTVRIDLGRGKGRGRVLPKTPMTARNLLSTKKDILKRNGNTWVFQYESRVKHLNINDEGEASWHSFVNGREAFFQSFNSYYDMLGGLFVKSVISKGKQYSGGGQTTPFPKTGMTKQKKMK